MFRGGWKWRLEEAGQKIWVFIISSVTDEKFIIVWEGKLWRAHAGADHTVNNENIKKERIKREQGRTDRSYYQPRSRLQNHSIQEVSPLSPLLLLAFAYNQVILTIS